jgi:hypothetical protein
MTIIDVLTNTSSQLTGLGNLLPHLLQPEALPRTLLSNASAATVAFIGTELARDFFHSLGHRWRWLLPHHLLHHTAYKPGYIKRLSHYYRSLWQHEVPESLVMVGVAGTGYFLTCYRPELADFQIGCGLILMHTLQELGIKLLRTCKIDWAIKADKNHQPVPLTAPPSQWFVNAAYHYRHHFNGDPNAYFSGIISLFDKSVGTALSLKGRTIVFVGEMGELESPLKQQLQQVGARVAPQDETIDLESTTILVINLNAVSSVGPQAIIQQMEQFLATVNGNEAIISKEIWLVLSDAESALALTSLDALYQRYLADWVTYRRTNAPCVLRKIIVGTHDSDRTTPQRLARRIVRALHRDSRNMVIRSHPLVHLYQPVKEWITATYLQTKH